MKRELRPSDVKKLSKICQEIKKTLSFDNPIMENEKKDLEKQSKRFKNLLEYSIPTDEIRAKEDMINEFFGEDPKDQYENIVFLQGSEADEALDILTNEGKDEAMEFLKQWHYPGEHELMNGEGHGSSDSIYKKDDYVMAYNTPMGYIGLQHKV